MLTKQKSREILKLKYLVLIPVLIVSLLYTSCGDTTIADTEEKIEIAGATKKELLDELIDELNLFTEAHKGVEILSEAQYGKQSELVAKIATFMASDDSKLSSKLNQKQSYEDYVVARKKSIAESNTYASQEKESIAFKTLDKAPTFPGCEGEATLEDLKSCFTLSIQKHVAKNFNTKLAENIGLSGVQKIYAKFIIDKNGDVTNIKVRAPHADLETEVKRVLNLVPKLIPGEKDGKAVKVNFMLPIAFKIQE